MKKIDTRNGMRSQTYRTSSKGRGCAEFGSHHITYTETVWADGRVDVYVTGHSDGETVNQQTMRQAEIEIDFDRIRAARVSAGWVLIGETV